MSLPPGSNKPAFLQLTQWLRDPLDYMDKASEEFGSLFTTRIFSSEASVMISDPKDMQTLFNHSGITAPGEKNEIARPLLGDNSVMMLSGEKHRQRRKLIMPHFQGEQMVRYTKIIQKITEQIIGQLETQKTFDVRNAMQEITLRVILQAVFGLEEGEKLEKLRQGLVNRIEMTSQGFGSIFIFLPILRQDWGAWSPWGKVMQKQRECDAMIYEEIRKRRANPDPERVDILNLLLATHDEDGQLLTEVELRDELMALLFAGHETTASSLTWALYWLHKFPEYREKLTQELAQLSPSAKPMEMFKLPYLTAVCNETLRIYSPAMLTLMRVLSSPVKMGEYTLDSGTSVIGSIYLTHRREDLYPQAKKFHPERFLERQYSPYEFLPFGGGHRRCIGMSLAQFEMKWVLATILQTVQLKLVSDEPLKHTRRGALLSPDNGFSMEFVGKRSLKNSELCLQD